MRLLLVGAAISMILCAGCDRADRAKMQSANLEVASAKSETVANVPRTWGAKLLSLVPSRGTEESPTVSAVQTLFRDCGLNGEKVTGHCRLEGSGDIELVVQVVTAGSRARALRLEACCAKDSGFFRPIASEAMLRSELICPQLTIAASESVEAFTVTAPGKRDFIYMRTEADTVRGRSVELAILFDAVQSGDECDALKALQK